MRLPRLAALAVLALLLPGCLGFVSRPSCDDFSVDREAWLAAGDGIEHAGGRARKRMAEAIVRCRVVHGKTRGQVRALLDLPTNGTATSRDWDYVLDESWMDWEFLWLDCWRTLSIGEAQFRFGEICDKPASPRSSRERGKFYPHT